jgi:WD40 repeat protein
MLLRDSGAVRSVAFSPDSTCIVSGSYAGQLSIWNTHTGNCLRQIRGHTEIVWSVAISSDGTLIASGSQDATVCLWDFATGELKMRLRGHSDTTRSVAFSPNGDRLYSASTDGAACAWSILPYSPENQTLESTVRPGKKLATLPCDEKPIQGWHRESNTYWRVDHDGWTMRYGRNKWEFDQASTSADGTMEKMFLLSQDECVEARFPKGFKPAKWWEYYNP